MSSRPAHQEAHTPLRLKRLIVPTLSDSPTHPPKLHLPTTSRGYVPDQIATEQHLASSGSITAHIAACHHGQEHNYPDTAAQPMLKLLLLLLLLLLLFKSQQ
jgi:hypothetical protein